ncbi:MAG: hypothetical protein Q7K98_01045 [Candidatus Omnitrophota bacterium]|nr:hypothetical protein [Candidatus Omnitrophota bacterium]
MIYLFVGQDSTLKDSPLSVKDTQLKQIKEVFLPKKVEQFNYDCLYAETLKLTDLQERLLCLPVNSPKRMIVVRNVQELAADIEAFILEWAKSGERSILLLLDIEDAGKKDDFLKKIHQYAKVFRFKETTSLNTFNLTRSIEERRPDHALRILDQLLKDGERPERIMGGLRYALEKSRLNPLEIKRRLRLLIDSDIEIKTGRVKPVLALEKLIVRLCALVQPFH